MFYSESKDEINYGGNYNIGIRQAYPKWEEAGIDGFGCRYIVKILETRGEIDYPPELKAENSTLSCIEVTMNEIHVAILMSELGVGPEGV